MTRHASVSVLLVLPLALSLELSSYLLPNVQVNGDAFIGRTFDNGDDFRRLDFKVSEVSSSAAWVQVWPSPQPLPPCLISLTCSVLGS